MHSAVLSLPYLQKPLVPVSLQVKLHFGLKGSFWRKNSIHVKLLTAPDPSACLKTQPPDAKMLGAVSALSAPRQPQALPRGEQGQKTLPEPRAVRQLRWERSSPGWRGRKAMAGNGRSCDSFRREINESARLALLWHLIPLRHPGGKQCREPGALPCN